MTHACSLPPLVVRREWAVPTAPWLRYLSMCSMAHPTYYLGSKPVIVGLTLLIPTKLTWWDEPPSRFGKLLMQILTNLSQYSRHLSHLGTVTSLACGCLDLKRSLASQCMKRRAKTIEPLRFRGWASHFSLLAFSFLRNLP